jgi:ATP-dependent exoDNAse (exonuclease V) beta subunit
LLNGQVIEDLGQDNIEVEPLFENHRSLKNIVTFNNMLIENIKERDNKYLNKLMSSCKAISEDTTKELKDIVNKAYINCTQEPENKSSEKGYAEVCEYDPKYEGETPLFIKAIEDAKRRGYNYNDILILVRWNSQGRKAAEALYAYKSTLTDEKDMFNILTSESLTIESCNVVRFIISTFRLAINHYDNVERAIFNEYLKRPYGMEFTTEDIEMLNTVAHLSPLEAFEYVVERFKLYEETKYIAYIQAVHDQIFAYVSNHVPDIQHYLSWWDERGHKESLSIEKTDQTIEITTIHKAKGLERDVVIIPYGELDMTPSSSRPPTIWAEARPLKDDDAHKRLSDIGEFPVVFGNAMMNSEFADEYYKELAMSHIDGLNILYVAVTRAKKELYMYIPKDLNPNKKSSKKKSEEQSNDDEPEVINTTTPLVINAVKEICKDNIHKELDASNEVKLIRYSYGEKCDVVNSVSENRSTIMDAYPTQKPNISVRKPSKRFLDEGLTPGTESCAKGIMLHKVFENAYNMQDLYNAIERLKTNNDVTAEEAEHLCANIDDALTNDLVAEWFNGEWDDIKCEAGIICKDNNIRPDRVMIKGNRAIVVDYKFGNKTSKSYNKKIKTYIDYLEKMKRYSDIEGYIWYVMLNKIEKV